MIDAPPQDLVTAVATAQRQWERAGLERRLQVLQDAGARLSESRPELYRGLRGDGLSTRLAHDYGEWIVRSTRPDLLKTYAQEHHRWFSAGSAGELLVRRPDGVVLLVLPSNSPTLNAAPLFSILLPGNGVVCRAPRNDLGLRFIAEDVLGASLEAFGFSRHLVTVVTDRTRTFLDRFLPEEAVRNVVFFGNHEAGQSVADRAHSLGKKAVLELEGSDHLIVWKDADVPNAVRSALRGFDFSSTPCPVPKHLLVHHEAYDTFVTELMVALPGCARTIAADAEQGTLIPLVDPSRYEHALAELIEAGGEVLAGGYRMDAAGHKDPAGPYAAPTLVGIEGSTLANHAFRCFTQEVDYPLMPVVRLRGNDEGIREAITDIVQQSPFALRTSVWAQEATTIGHFTRELGHLGLLLFNDDHAQCPQFLAPWGGPRRSGGPHGEHHLFWAKTSHLQGIGCLKLPQPQLRAVFEALGATAFGEEAGILLPPPKPRAPVPPADVPEGRVELTISDHVARITLQRPDRHNAITGAMIRDLATHLETVVDWSSRLHAVVLRGAGPSFCSGGDLDQLRGFDATAARRFMSEATWVFRRLEQLPVPVIALVQGYCMGGGLELALHCDEVVAAEDAVFAFPETRVGYVTTAGSVARLVDAVGSVRARRMLLPGSRISGAEAFAMGLVTATRPQAELDDMVQARLVAYRALPRPGVAAMKRLLRGHLGPAQAQSWTAESETFESLVAERRRNA